MKTLIITRLETPSDTVPLTFEVVGLDKVGMALITRGYDSEDVNSVDIPFSDVDAVIALLRKGKLEFSPKAKPKTAKRGIPRAKHTRRKK